jgi:hypothetical protein
VTKGLYCSRKTTGERLLLPGMSSKIARGRRVGPLPRTKVVANQDPCCPTPLCSGTTRGRSRGRTVASVRDLPALRLEINGQAAEQRRAGCRGRAVSDGGVRGACRCCLGKKAKNRSRCMAPA